MFSLTVTAHEYAHFETTTTTHIHHAQRPPPRTTQAAVSRKLARLEAFVAMCNAPNPPVAPGCGAQAGADLPVLMLVATSRDENRKGCTTKAGDAGGTGLSTACLH